MLRFPDLRVKRIGFRNYFDKYTQTARQSGPFYGQNLSNGVPICHKHPQKRGTERSKLLSLATESFPNPMNPGKTLLLLQFLLCAATAAAQSAEVRFRVADRATQRGRRGRRGRAAQPAPTPRRRHSIPLRTSTDAERSPACRTGTTASPSPRSVTTRCAATCGSARQPSGSIRCGSRPAPKPSTR